MMKVHNCQRIDEKSIRHFVRLIIERKTDIEHHKLAQRIYSDTYAAVKGKTISGLGMRIDNVETSETVIAHTTFKKLGVTLPDQLNDLSLGVMIASDWMLWIDDGVSIQPGRLDFLPGGGVVIGLNLRLVDNDDGEFYTSVGVTRGVKKLKQRKDQSNWYTMDTIGEIDMGWLLDARKGVFIHEIVHQLDANYRADAANMHAKTKQDLDARKYAETQHEQNAFFIQAFDDMITTFTEKYGDHPTQSDAAEFAPNASTLWKLFNPHINTIIRNHFKRRKFGSKLKETPDALKRKYAARLNDMWDEYTSSLT